MEKVCEQASGFRAGNLSIARPTSRAVVACFGGTPKWVKGRLVEVNINFMFEAKTAL